MPNGNLLIAHENHLIEVDRNDVSRKFADVPDPYFTTWWLRWSPDSRTVRFSAGTPDRNAIWEVLSDGSQAHNELITLSRDLCFEH